MAHTYEKNTKSNTDIPKVSLFLLQSILGKINSKEIDLNKFESNFSISIVVSNEYPYCHEAIVPIQRTFKALDWTCRMTHYERRENGDKVKHGYVFSFNKIKKVNFDDLPF